MVLDYLGLGYKIWVLFSFIVYMLGYFVCWVVLDVYYFVDVLGCGIYCVVLF